MNLSTGSRDTPVGTTRTTEIAMSKRALLAATGACAAPAMLTALLLTASGATAQSPGKFTTKPPISCAFGKVVDGRCICPPGWRRVHAGLNAWRCLRPDPWIGSLKSQSKKNSLRLRPL
jgi:hypothetical protein